MIKKQIPKIELLKPNSIDGLSRKGALGAREARREKRQSRAVLAAVWGLLEQLAIRQKLLQKKVVENLDPKAKLSLQRSIIELCSAFKRVSITATRWADHHNLLKWNWVEVKRVIRHLDGENSRSIDLRQALIEQIQDHLDNAPRSYAQLIDNAKDAEQIYQIVKGAEKAQRAQLTRLQTELDRCEGESQFFKNQRTKKSSQSDRFMSAEELSDEQHLTKRLRVEIERARDSLGRLTAKIASHMIKDGDVKAPMKVHSTGANGHATLVAKRRGRPPNRAKIAIEPPTELSHAQQKWEMAYQEIKKLLKASRRRGHRVENS